MRRPAEKSISTEGAAANVRSVNPLGKISLYVLAIVLIAAVLSPPAYWALHDLNPFLSEVPFHRFFNRVALGAALVLLVPTLLWLNVRSRAELGLVRNPHARRDLLAGLGLALLPLVALAAVYFGADIYRVKKEIPWGNLLKIAGTLAVVPILEECLFRGVLLGLAVRHLGRWSGIVVVSLAFAVVHFIRQHGEVTDVTWASGFQLLVTAFPAADAMPETLAGGLNLFVIGVILAVAALRTRSLWLPIGLHAGWILGQQTINLVGKYRVKPPDAFLPWVGPNVVSGMVPTGVVPLVALLVTGLLVWWYLARAWRPAPESAPAAV
jgi:membrane protease YdiL (CAAX protease family)